MKRGEIPAAPFGLSNPRADLFRDVSSHFFKSLMIEKLSSDEKATQNLLPGRCGLGLVKKRVIDSEIDKEMNISTWWETHQIN